MKYDENNIFSRIINKEIPSKIIMENNYAMSFYDAFPKYKIHALVIPKGKYCNWLDFENNASDKEKLEFWTTVQQTVQKLELSDGFRILSNNGKNSLQEIQHFHLHIIGGEILKEI